ncbi:DMT family transporter [Bacteroidales bacterium OttesenSCG-928-C03]|nr:DMT family transporter [Bacteroidales bacterium OttesenSCG-928-E04]MDL2308608.1 DMT family transporter [Bacteroidales bacterium OttesenSCG-928-C03]
MKSQNTHCYLLLLFAATFWGGSFVFTKHLLESLDPVSIIFIRLVISSAFLLIISFFFLRKHLRIKKRDVKIVLIFSFFEPFLYFIFETYSLQFTSASIVSIIIATIPLFTAMLSKYYFKEHFSNLNMAGAIISITGIAVMLLPEFFGATAGLIGVGLAFLAVLSAVGYGYYVKKLSEAYHPVVVVTYQNTIGAIIFLPLFLIMNQFSGTNITAALSNPVNLINLLILAVFCSSLAFIFFLRGIQVLGLGKANVFSNLIPVATAIISFILLGEEFPIYKIIGMGIVILGIFLVQKRDSDVRV